MIMKWLLGPVRNPLQMVYSFRNALKHQYSLQKSDLLKLQIGKANKYLPDGQVLGKLKMWRLAYSSTNPEMVVFNPSVLYTGFRS